MIFDQRVIRQVRPRQRNHDAQAIARLLIQIPHLSDRDLTEVSDSEVCAKVSQFLRARLPDNFFSSTDSSQLDAFHQALRVQFDSERLRDAMNLYESLIPNDRLTNTLDFAPLGITARAFCQRHGIRLPYRLTGPDLYSRVGLSQAVEQAIHMQPTSVLLVDHAQANHHDESWQKAKLMLERRGIDSRVYTVE